MIVATWNVNSVRSRLNHLLKWLGSNPADVLCLQETKCVDEKFPEARFSAAGYQSSFFGESSYNGVAILSKHTITNVQKNMPDDDDESSRRFIAADIDGIRVVNIYVPQGTKLWTEKFDFKLEWLRRLRLYFDRNCPRDSDLLLCGDFNVAPTELDVFNAAKCNGKIHFSGPERAAIDNVMEWGFTDVYRMLNPGVKEYSFWDLKTKRFKTNHGLRLDHIWASEEMADRCLNSWIDKKPRGWEKPSDHAPVVAEFE